MFKKNSSTGVEDCLGDDISLSGQTAASSTAVSESFTGASMTTSMCQINGASSPMRSIAVPLSATRRNMMLLNGALVSPVSSTSPRHGYVMYATNMSATSWRNIAATSRAEANEEDTTLWHMLSGSHGEQVDVSFVLL